MAFKNPWGKGSSQFGRWMKKNPWGEGGEHTNRLNVLSPDRYDHTLTGTLGSVTYSIKFDDDSPQKFVISTDAEGNEKYDFFTKTDNPGRDSGWHEGSLSLFGPATTVLLPLGGRDVKKLRDMKYGSKGVKVLDILDALMTQNGSFHIGIIGNVRVSSSVNTENVIIYNIVWPNKADIAGFTLERANVTKSSFFKNNNQVDTKSRATATASEIANLDLPALNDDWCGVVVYLKYEEFTPENTREN